MKRRIIFIILFVSIELAIIIPLAISKLNNQKEIEIKNMHQTSKENQDNQTITILKNQKQFNEKYEQEYQQINYIDIENFGIMINTFLDKKYSSNEINNIFENYYDYLNILLNMNHINILEFQEASNFNKENIERYLNYIELNQNYDIKTAITYVNIGLDLEGYSKYTTYTNELVDLDLTILVNKYHRLREDYEPSDLVSLSYNENYKLRSVAAQSFEKLMSAALLDNVIIYPFSCYRSYNTQDILYNRYKERDGETLADTYSARPGFSEHQLGLAVDIRSNTKSANLTDQDYIWILNNSYKYGFIVRYPKGKQHITQFIEEPWHLRYLGIDLATKVHNSGLTYDEYYDLYIKPN